MLLHFIRQLRSRKERFHHKETAGQPQSSALKVRIDAAFRKYEQRLPYHQKKMGLILFFVISTCFFTWLLIESLGRGHPFHPSVERSIVGPPPPILSDTHSLPQIWQQLHSYFDSVHHQSLQHDTIKDH